MTAAQIVSTTKERRLLEQSLSKPTASIPIHSILSINSLNLLFFFLLQLTRDKTTVSAHQLHVPIETGGLSTYETSPEMEDFCTFRISYVLVITG